MSSVDKPARYTAGVGVGLGAVGVGLAGFALSQSIDNKDQIENRTGFSRYKGFDYTTPTSGDQLTPKIYVDTKLALKGGTLSGPIIQLDRTPSTDPTSGALRVSGGVGVVGDLNVGDDMNCGGELNCSGDLNCGGGVRAGNILMTGNTITSTDTNGDITINPNGPYISGGKVRIANDLEIYDDRYNQQFFKFYPAFFPFGEAPGTQGAMGISASAYNDPTEYPFIRWEGSSGGAFSIGRSRFYSRDTEVFNLQQSRMEILQDLVVSSNTPSTLPANGSITTAGGLGVAENIHCGGTTPSTSSITGSITTAGGLGVAENIHCGGTTPSTSSLTGSITTAGGLGVAENINCGGNLTVTGTVSVNSDDIKAAVVEILNAGNTGNGNSQGWQFEINSSIIVTSLQIPTAQISGGGTRFIGIWDATTLQELTSAWIDTLNTPVVDNIYTYLTRTRLSPGTYIIGVYKESADSYTSVTATFNSPIQNVVAVSGGPNTIPTLLGLTSRPGMGTFTFYDETSQSLPGILNTDTLNVVDIVTGSIKTAGNITCGGTTPSTSSITGSVTTAGGLGVAENINCGGGISCIGMNRLITYNLHANTTESGSINDIWDGDTSVLDKAFRLQGPISDGHIEININVKILEDFGFSGVLTVYGFDKTELEWFTVSLGSTNIQPLIGTDVQEWSGSTSAVISDMTDVIVRSKTSDNGNYFTGITAIKIGTTFLTGSVFRSNVVTEQQLKYYSYDIGTPDFPVPTIYCSNFVTQASTFLSSPTNPVSLKSGEYDIFISQTDARIHLASSTDEKVIASETWVNDKLADRAYGYVNLSDNPLLTDVVNANIAYPIEGGFTSNVLSAFTLSPAGGTLTYSGSTTKTFQLHANWTWRTEELSGDVFDMAVYVDDVEQQCKTASTLTNIPHTFPPTPITSVSDKTASLSFITTLMPTQNIQLKLRGNIGGKQVLISQLHQTITQI